MQDKLTIRAKPKQPIQINKVMVIVIVSVITFIILFAVISAFNVTKTIKTNETLKAKTNKPMTISAELSSLPSGYTDINTIKKYSASGQQSMEMMQLQQQLDELKNAYAFLQKSGTNNQVSLEKTVSDPRTEQAKNSSLVFAGLGTGIDNVIGGTGSGSGPIGSRYGYDHERGLFPSQETKPADIIATKEQEEFFNDQAKNTQKVDLMKAALDKSVRSLMYEKAPLMSPISKYQIQAGTIIQTSLITGIDTSLAGTIVAQIRNDLYDTVSGKYLLIPKGSRLLGEYESRTNFGQRRIMMYFTRIILPNGDSIPLDKPPAADLLGRSGIEGNVDNHWAQIVSAAAISTLFSVGAGVASDRYSKPNEKDSKQSGILGGAGEIASIGKNFASKAMDIPPTIKVNPGHQFLVTVKKDLILKPFKRKR